MKRPIPTVDIVTIGDEILLGHTLDTNSHWLCQVLSKANIKVKKKVTVSDCETDILAIFDALHNRNQIVIFTGGLGSTHDDITKKCISTYFQDPLSFEPKLYDHIKKLYEKRGRKVNEFVKTQAYFPKNAEIIPNKRGTAPGIWKENNSSLFLFLPGVPDEMQQMMLDEVLPKLTSQFEIPPIYHQFINTCGIGETALAEMLQEWQKDLPKNIKLAYLPNYSQVKLRISAEGENIETLKKDVANHVEKCKNTLGDFIFSEGDIPIESQIGIMLKANHLNIALAESCTGGYLAHLITSVAGSSEYFKGGCVPYSNEMKIRLLGVNERTLQSKGAVSEDTVIEMARNVKKIFSTSVGLAISGIAGPGGGSDSKPVGTVWIAASIEETIMTKKLLLTQNRAINIRKSATEALILLFSLLKGRL